MTYEDISGPVAYKDILGPVTIENVIFLTSILQELKTAKREKDEVQKELDEKNSAGGAAVSEWRPDRQESFNPIAESVCSIVLLTCAAGYSSES